MDSPNLPIIQQDNSDFKYWEKTKDLIDQLLDIVFNYRQSGHPGGSRSKVHLFLSLILSGAMKWDIRDPSKKFSDRFILSAGHTVPLVYCSLALLNEAMLIRYQQTHDARYAIKYPAKRILRWEDLLDFRHRGGLSGHAEMQGKTLFLKFNTGSSGHGSVAAVGEALALKRAGADKVRVFALEGEGGLTPGANHEALNSAWGLNLDNLFFLIDWNDFGIDDRPFSDVVYGNPEDWFASHGWNVSGTEHGEDWLEISMNLNKALADQERNPAPNAFWVKTRKGRGYLKYDNHSHGSPHPMNSDTFWETKRIFAEKYNADFCNFGGAAPSNKSEVINEFRCNLQEIIRVFSEDQDLINYLSDRLVTIAELVPDEIPNCIFTSCDNPLKDPRLFDFENYPGDLFAKPGEHLPNRAALGKWGSWVNAFGAKTYNRPIFIACSADLSESTNVSGFGKGYHDFPGYGWYKKTGTNKGVLLPQAITEMANSGILSGLATVNFSDNPENEFNGFWGVCSTYGAFSYLKYGMFRLFSQMAQDCEWKVGKILWVLGHSGPETAEDSRTHYGIFAPGVTKLFPVGKIINLFPWEYNEVPVLLGAALKEDVPLIALHLTRPPIEIPDRKSLGIPSYFETAKGAYIIQDADPSIPLDGTFVIQGPSAMSNTLKLFPSLQAAGMNIKLVYASSYELFSRQSEEYQNKVITKKDRANSTVITTGARYLANDWVFNHLSKKYVISPDWDNEWRTGGNLEEILEESHLSPDQIEIGIKQFVFSKKERLHSLKAEIDQAMNLS